MYTTWLSLGFINLIQNFFMYNVYLVSHCRLVAKILFKVAYAIKKTALFWCIIIHEYSLNNFCSFILTLKLYWKVQWTPRYPRLTQLSLSKDPQKINTTVLNLNIPSGILFTLLESKKRRAHYTRKREQEGIFIWYHQLSLYLWIKTRVICYEYTLPVCVMDSSSLCLICIWSHKKI